MGEPIPARSQDPSKRQQECKSDSFSPVMPWERSARPCPIKPWPEGEGAPGLAMGEPQELTRLVGTLARRRPVAPVRLQAG